MLPKTIENVVEWMQCSTKCAKARASDISQMCADGATNASGSIAELETTTRTIRCNDTDVKTCVAHQNERAGGYASGTSDFANPVNVEMGLVLKKSHDIQSLINRSTNRMKIYKDIQKKNQREPMLNPKPANDTRWNGRQIETRRACEIMVDIQPTLKKLFEEGGMDYHMLTAQEKNSANIDRLIYTDDDKMVLRQWEASAMEAVYFSKFTQERGNSYSYLLLEIQTTLHRVNRDWFEMSAGKFVL